VKQYKARAKPVRLIPNSKYAISTQTLTEYVWLPNAFQRYLDDKYQGYGIRSYAQGQRVWTIWRNQHREIVGPAESIWRFELKDDLAPGSYAAAYLYPWDDTFGAYLTDTATEFNVYDVLGIWRGRGRGKYSSPHNEGSKGYAKFMPDAATYGRWEIVQMQQHALMIQGDVYDDFDTGDETFEISSVHIMQPIGSLITDFDPAGNATVYNIFHWEGSTGGCCIAAWNEHNVRWEALQVECV